MVGARSISTLVVVCRARAAWIEQEKKDRRLRYTRSTRLGAEGKEKPGGESTRNKQECKEKDTLAPVSQRKGVRWKTPPHRVGNHCLLLKERIKQGVRCKERADKEQGTFLRSLPFRAICQKGRKSGDRIPNECMPRGDGATNGSRERSVCNAGEPGGAVCGAVLRPMVFYEEDHLEHLTHRASTKGKEPEQGDGAGEQESQGERTRKTSRRRALVLHRRAEGSVASLPHHCTERTATISKYKP